MYKKSFSIICLVSIFVFTTAFLGVTPSWSAPGDKKPTIQKPLDKGEKEPGDLKGSKKGKKSVKKKAAKKVGTAAAIGVVGAKVTSGIKGTVIKDKE